MTGLDTLLVAGGMVSALAGAAKFRPGTRNRMGTSPLALAELGVGSGAVLLGVIGAGPEGLRILVLVLALAALVAGGLHQSSVNRAWRARRAASEEARLQVFLRAKGVAPGIAAGGSPGSVPPPAIDRRGHPGEGQG